MNQKICLYCGRKFTPFRDDIRIQFCNKNCSVYHWRKLNNTKYKQRRRELWAKNNLKHKKNYYLNQDKILEINRKSWNRHKEKYLFQKKEYYSKNKDRNSNLSRFKKLIIKPDCISNKLVIVKKDIKRLKDEIKKLLG